jgi:IS5 family transposase
LLHGQETLAFGDADDQGIEKRPDRQAEKLKAGIRAKVEHPFRVLKRQFGFVKVRYCGLKKNTAQRFTLLALSSSLYISKKSPPTWHPSSAPCASFSSLDML